MDALTDQLLGPAEPDPLKLRQGVVTQITPTLLVRVGAATTAVPATTFGNYNPAVNDVVSVLEQAGDRIVLGPAALNTWQTPGSFQNGWSNYGAGSRPVRFRREGFDLVRIEGLVAGGTLNATVFDLPAGYRPTTNLHFASQSNITFGLVYVNAAGSVQFWGTTNVYASLNVTFATS